MSKNLLRKLFRLTDDSHDVGFLHNQKVLSINFHLCTAPFAVQGEVFTFYYDLFKISLWRRYSKRQRF